MRIYENSLLRLTFDFNKEKDKTIWDVTSVLVGEDKRNRTFVGISRKKNPAKELSDKFHSDWESSVEEKFPYNKTAYSGDQITKIVTILKQPDTKTHQVLYSVAYGQDGNVEQKETEAKLDKFLRNLTVYVYGQSEYATRNKGGNTYHYNGEYYRAVWNIEEISQM